MSGLRSVPLLLAAVALCGGVAAVGESKPDPSGKGPRPPAGDSLIIESALVAVIDEAEVPARVEGVLAELTAREGSLVSAGDALAKIEDAEPALTLKRADIDWEIARRQATSDLRTRVARKGAEVADVELKRARESVEKYKKSVSETELDRLRLSAEKAALDVDQTIQDHEIAGLTMQLKEAERDLAAAAVDRRRIISPIAGMVVQVHRHRGEWVEPGQTLVRVLRIDRMRVEGLVPAKRLEGDLMGRRAVLAVDLPGKPGTEFDGEVVFVSPEVNPVNGQVRVWAEVVNRDNRLRPGLQGTLTIHVEPARGAGAPASDQATAR